MFLAISIPNSIPTPYTLFSIMGVGSWKELFISFPSPGCSFHFVHGEAKPKTPPTLFQHIEADERIHL